MRLVISDLHLFHLVVLLTPDFNCSKKLLSSSVDKVTTGIYNFVSVNINIAFVAETCTLGTTLVTFAALRSVVATVSLFALLNVTKSLYQCQSQTSQLNDGLKIM